MYRNLRTEHLLGQSFQDISVTQNTCSSFLPWLRGARGFSRHSAWLKKREKYKQSIHFLCDLSDVLQLLSWGRNRTQRAKCLDLARGLTHCMHFRKSWRGKLNHVWHLIILGDWAKFANPWMSVSSCDMKSWNCVLTACHLLGTCNPGLVEIIPSCQSVLPLQVEAAIFPLALWKLPFLFICIVNRVPCRCAETTSIYFCSVLSPKNSTWFKSSLLRALISAVWGTERHHKILSTVTK